MFPSPDFQPVNMEDKKLGTTLVLRKEHDFNVSIHTFKGKSTILSFFTRQSSGLSSLTSEKNTCLLSIRLEQLPITYKIEQKLGQNY